MVKPLRKYPVSDPLYNAFTTTAWVFQFLNAQVRLYKEAWLAPNFRQAVQQIANLPPGKMPTRKTLAGLLVGWGNNSFAANLDYLEEVAKMATDTPGPILECGSGLTTIILGLLAGRRGVEIWSLEHIPKWYTRVNTTLQRYCIPGVNIHLSLLRDYGGFFWYEAPLTSLPNEFRLVICDGPPSKTPGGRYGLLPVLGQRLSAETLLLLDDANRAGEAEVLHRWKTEAGVSVLLREMPSGTFALVAFR